METRPNGNQALENKKINGGDSYLLFHVLLQSEHLLNINGLPLGYTSNFEINLLYCIFSSVYCYISPVSAIGYLFIFHFL